MIENIKKVLKPLLIAGFGSLVLVNCESDADNLGTQFFVDNTTDGATQSYDVVAYHLNHHDTIQSDASKLTQATLGAFDESNFGLQKSDYVTQVRLSSYSPDFGVNAKVDSVTLEIKPNYVSDSATTVTDENAKFNGEDVKKVVTTYPVKKYGKTQKITLKVHEVNDFLYSTDKKYYSDFRVNTGTELGSYEFNGKVNSVKITSKTEGKEVFSRDEAIRIPLNTNFFQTKIVDQHNSADLQDVASFIRYFKGVKISVAENDGYIFNFSPNNVTIKMYYSHDVTNNGTTTKTAALYQFNLGSGNVHFNQIDYQRPTAYQTAMNNIDETQGDERLYLQGMGGAGAVLKIPAATISEIKKQYKEDKIGILSAKIRFYTDASVWSNSYEKPSRFLVKYANLNEFLSDMAAFSSLGGFSLIKSYDLDKNPAYYDLSITQTLKNIIEKEAENRDLVLNIGDYIYSNQGLLLGQNYNTRAYAPQRLVLVGSKTTDTNKVKLNIIYAKK
ncbi:DUF4270 domain-containing protein [Riemerella columbina]|uniref:DUF4270 domain-containing protein n=1 Tax=Riemerella columbina TaxID=103810 RepID=UPI00266F512C|nr:DUF4270 domain-containing protein [Riemerella columbina]WKS95839.1 DUF4270 domain-containing protein [Riemerella columbina]